jgi:hypothetical protein
MLKLFMIVALLASASAAAVPSNDDAALGPVLAKVRAHAQAVGDRIWPGYGAAPFEFLLTLEDREVLLCRTAPTAQASFTPDGVDPATRCSRQVRPRSTLANSMLAAMPLFGLPPTIVMGTPTLTHRTQGAWVRTIYHEHFHQYQYSQPGYFAKLTALDLTGGDTTGMWVLNYPFPYREPAVGQAYGAASLALAAAVEARGTPAFRQRFDDYLAARSTFERSVSARDWRYLELELWQEGVARWTEIAVARTDPDPLVETAAENLERATVAALSKPDLPGRGREIVYAHGAAEAMLMEACDPRWRRGYFQVFALGPQLREARAHCAPARHG